MCRAHSHTGNIVVTNDQLIQAAKRIKLQSDQAVGWPLAVIKALQSYGITRRDTVERRSKVILSLLGQQGGRANKRTDRPMISKYSASQLRDFEQMQVQANGHIVPFDPEEAPHNAYAE